jgi:hypothetical protein
MANYPYTQTTKLPYGIQATTTVIINAGLQVAQIDFTNAAGLLGEIVLSVVQPTANLIEFKRGNQLLKIDAIAFRAQFGFDKGSVSLNATMTDEKGQNPTTFASQICSWDRPDIT